MYGIECSNKYLKDQMQIEMRERAIREAEYFREFEIEFAARVKARKRKERAKWLRAVFKWW